MTHPMVVPKRIAKVIDELKSKKKVGERVYQHEAGPSRNNMPWLVALGIVRAIGPKERKERCLGRAARLLGSNQDNIYEYIGGGA